MQNDKALYGYLQVLQPDFLTFRQVEFANVTRSGKTGLIRTFYISRNAYLKYSMRCPSLVVQYNHARCIILIV